MRGFSSISLRKASTRSCSPLMRSVMRALKSAVFCRRSLLVSGSSLAYSAFDALHQGLYLLEVALGFVAENGLDQ
jgi:hypothetical protein